MGRKSRRKLDRRRQRERKPLANEVENPEFDNQLISRRRFLVKMSALSAALGFGAYFLLEGEEKEEARSLNEESSAPDLVNSVESDITLVNEVIVKAETGMAEFESIMMPKIKQVTNPYLRKQMALPFEQININVDNPNKNSLILLQRHRTEGFLRQQNLSWFSYKVKSHAGMAAAFAPVLRMMYLDKNFDPQNFLDLLVLYHELLHVTQDNASRGRLDSKEQYEAYNKFYMSNKLVLNLEVTAYALEIEALNLYLDNYIKKQISEGKEIDIHEIQIKLNARPNQLGTIKMLIDLAKLYYPEGLSSANFNPKFFHKVGEFYSQQRGYELYMKTPQGLQKYEDYLLNN